MLTTISHAKRLCKNRPFSSAFLQNIEKELDSIREAGTWKNERIIISPQDTEITVSSGAKVLNFCANNYLGLSNDSRINKAAKNAIDYRGYGLSSVRFICGTQVLI
jgi:glycine C-acetyltransferase